MFGNIRNLICLLILLCVAAGSAASVFGQVRTPPKPTKIKDYMPKPGAPSPGFFNGDGETIERSITVDPNVSLKLCVANGDLQINGSRRNEVRVFVRNGRNFHFKPLEKSPQTGKVNWLEVRPMVEGRPGPGLDCLAGETIEIDVPLNAGLDLTGGEVTTSIDSVRKASVRIRAGAVMLRNITGGINAQTNRGEMVVENSSGGITLVGFGGNMIIADVKAGQVGDLLSVKTNAGAITMQRVEHRQIQATSTSGQLLFDGKFLPGGIYNFRTSTGSINLRIPVMSSCIFTATYGKGEFSTDIAHKIITKDETAQAKVLVAKIGSGDATVHLTATNGSIEIRKSSREKP
jgi:DUF4097 and DUF4098 domain-containing protein YvlB